MIKKPRKIEPIFYTFQEAQEFLSISHNTLYKLMEQGLPSHKIGRKIKAIVRPGESDTPRFPP